MSFIVLEDLQKPLRRRFTFITSIRIIRPIYKMARFTYRSSRFLLQKAIWVFRGDRKEQPTTGDVNGIMEVENNK